MTLVGLCCADAETAQVWSPDAETDSGQPHAAASRPAESASLPARFMPQKCGAKLTIYAAFFGSTTRATLSGRIPLLNARSYASLTLSDCQSHPSYALLTLKQPRGVANRLDLSSTC